jgi:hypothetical protein
LDEAFSRGLRFITDSDARAEGGAHVFAHLWDNGNYPHEELDAVLALRHDAIANFSEHNIRSSEPYSMLEDVFVPLYFFHRYQVEAATKVIGGLDYNYKIKGDSQFSTRPVEAAIQRKTLVSISKTLSANTIAIPKNKLGLFPPRSYGFKRTRESFKGKTGVAFDPLSAASTASNLTLKFLLHPERANRLVLQKSLDSDQLGFRDVLNVISEESIKEKHRDAYLNEVQAQITHNFLIHLMSLATSEKSYFQVKAIANKFLSDFATTMPSLNFPEAYKIQFGLMIKEYFDEPQKFKAVPVPKIPDGSPIGMDSCSFNY